MVAVTAIIHTFDGYSRFHVPVLYFWYRFGPDIPLIFTYEENDPWPIFEQVQRLLDGAPRVAPIFVKCGSGSSWSYRLKKGLTYVRTPFVLYLQEDIWLTQAVTSQFFESCVTYMTQQKLQVLKMQDEEQGYFEWRPAHSVPFHGPFKGQVSDGPLDWNDPTVYIFSHQPFISTTQQLWDWLPALDEKQMTPFQHETSVNRMLHKREKEPIEIQWLPKHLERQFVYDEVSQRGSISVPGLEMLKRYGLPSDDFIHVNQSNQNQTAVWIREDF